jgi:hypothetical protein
MADPELSLDGAGTGGTTLGSAVSAKLSTADSSDVLIAFVVASGPASSLTCSDGKSLTWTQRATLVTSGYTGLWELYAISPNAISSDTVTCTTNQGPNNLAMTVFGVNGADTSEPFDPTVSPHYETGQGTAPSVAITTSAPDFLVGLMGAYGSNSEIAGTDMTLISDEEQPPTSAAEFMTTALPGGPITVGISQPATNYWAFIGDAILASGAHSWKDYYPYSSSFTDLSPYTATGCGSNVITVSPVAYSSTGETLADVGSTATCLYGIYQTGFSTGFYPAEFTAGATGYVTIEYDWYIQWSGSLETSSCALGADTASILFEAVSNLYVENTQSWNLGSNNVWTIESQSLGCGLSWGWSGAQTITPSFTAYLVQGDTYLFYTYLYGDTYAADDGLDDAYSTLNVGSGDYANLDWAYLS